MSEHQDNDDTTPAFPGPWGSLADSDPAAPVLSAVEGRHDGWTGAVMAKFCEALAETGVVLEACVAVGKSSNTAYSTRRRDPLFAAMWEAALGIARNRLADALLARSIEGSVEYYYRDGALVGEKRLIDNRLGLAVLRRLDRIAELGTPHSARGEPARAPAAAAPALDWDQMIGALRSREPGAMAVALAALESGEARETHDPPNPFNAGPGAGPGADDDEDEIEDGVTRVWQSDDNWWTDYPPPAGFNGVEHGSWGRMSYKRACTEAETALLDSSTALDRAEDRAEDDAERDSYFADLAAEQADADEGAGQAEPEADDEAGPDATPLPSSSRTGLPSK